jgi:TP901 family phage tail tape measure protein
MTDTAVIFDIIGKDRVSPAVASSGAAFNKFALGLAASAAFAGAKMVDMAGNFQVGMTRLKTGAGEVDSNMKIVSDGILEMAGQVGESTKDLLSGMYLIESAGFHGAEGLNVLRVAAEGAKVGNADMATVADAVTTGLNAYRMGADKATAVTNALIAAEGQGKTNLEALAGSLATVAPIAATAHVSLNEVLGAMATMTGEGTDAASAATYLRQTIGQLANPSQKAAMEMKALGLNAIDVSQNLGKNGLASTLTILTDAIEKKMGPSGVVLIQKLQAASKNTSDFQKVLANLPPTQQTFVGALANMVGGTKSMQAALELTGANMTVFQHNTDVINEKVKTGGSTIEGWADVQKNFNQRMAEARGTIESLSIKIGSALLPYAQKMLDTTMSLVGWFTRHKAVAQDLAAVIGIAAGAFIAYRTYVTLAGVATKAWMVATQAASAAQWLLNVAMDANPVGLIIIAILALVAGIWLLWTHSKGFRDFFIGLWNDIWGFLKAVGSWFAGPFSRFFIDTWNDIWGFFKAVGSWFAGPFAGFFVSAAHAVAAPFLWLWHNVLDPLWHGFESGVAFVANIVRSFINLWLDFGNWFFGVIYKGYVKPAIDGIGAAFMWVGKNIFEPVTHAIIVVLTAIGSAAMWLWHNAILPAVHGIGDAFMWVGKNVFQPVMNFIMDIIHGVAAVMTWWWQNVTMPVVHGVAEAAMWVWHMLESAFDFVMDKVHTVGHVFSTVFGAIGGFISSAFSTAVSVVKGAINSIIRLINGAIGFINHDLIDSANKLPGVSFPHIPNVPYLYKGGTVAQGGMAFIADRGPELVTLPTGATVTPLSGNDGGDGRGGSRTVTFKGNADTLFASIFMKMVRSGLIQID